MAKIFEIKVCVTRSGWKRGEVYFVLADEADWPLDEADQRRLSFVGTDTHYRLEREGRYISKYVCIVIGAWDKNGQSLNIIKNEINDPVNHPSYYTDGRIEVIEFIEDKQLNFHRGQVIKYVARAGKKDATKELEDLKKAAWYLNREIEKLSNGK